MKLLGSSGIVFVTFSVHNGLAPSVSGAWGEERCIHGGGET